MIYNHNQIEALPEPGADGLFHYDNVHYCMMYSCTGTAQ